MFNPVESCRDTHDLSANIYHTFNSFYLALRKVNDEAKPIIARRSTRLQDKLKSTTCMKPWTTNDKRVGQRGKKNPQTSDFAKKASESGLTTQ
jgi:hypothetical protein